MEKHVKKFVNTFFRYPLWYFVVIVTTNYGSTLVTSRGRCGSKFEKRKNFTPGESLQLSFGPNIKKIGQHLRYDDLPKLNRHFEIFPLKSKFSKGHRNRPGGRIEKVPKETRAKKPRSTG